jgi:hypothetical protein
LWKERANAMTVAMDSLISVDDFLAVTQEHITDDVKNGVTVNTNKSGLKKLSILGNLWCRS